jgi:hypothetical protein
MPLYVVCVKYLYDNVQNIKYSFGTVAIINMAYPTTFVIANMVFDTVGYPAFFNVVFKALSLLR